jgi:hypothetical protein
MGAVDYNRRDEADTVRNVYFQQPAACYIQYHTWLRY